MKTYHLKTGLLITEDTEGEEIIEDPDATYRIEMVPVWKWLLIQD